MNNDNLFKQRLLVINSSSDKYNELNSNSDDNNNFITNLVKKIKNKCKNINLNKDNIDINDNSEDINKVWIDLEDEFPSQYVGLKPKLEDKIIIKCKRTSDYFDIDIVTYQQDYNGIRYFLSTSGEKYIYGPDAEKLGYNKDECKLAYSWMNIPKF